MKHALIIFAFPKSTNSFLEEKCMLVIFGFVSSVLAQIQKRFAVLHPSHTRHMKMFAKK
jgi:hypothetical protein